MKKISKKLFYMVSTVFIICGMLLIMPGSVYAEDGPFAVTGVTLNKNSTTLVEGGSEVLIATVSPLDATNKNVAWASDDETIATVDSSGNVTAIKKGNADITVTTVDGDYTATCAIEVVKDNGPDGETTPQIVINKLEGFDPPVSGAWTTGDIKGYQEGEYVQVRVELTSNEATASGTFQVIYTSKTSGRFFAYEAPTDVLIDSGASGNYVSDSLSQIDNDNAAATFQIDFSSVSTVFLYFKLHLASDAADYANGSSQHIAIGDNFGGQVVKPTGNKSLPVMLKAAEPVPGISLTKTADPTTANPGDIITYSFTVENTGDVDLTNVILNDPMLDFGNGVGEDFNLGTLAAHDTLSPNPSATYVAQTTDIGNLVNIATVTSNEGPTDTDTATVTVTAEPGGGEGPSLSPSILGLTIEPELEVAEISEEPKIEVAGISEEPTIEVAGITSLPFTGQNTYLAVLGSIMLALGVSIMTLMIIKRRKTDAIK